MAHRHDRPNSRRTQPTTIDGSVEGKTRSEGLRRVLGHCARCTLIVGDSVVSNFDGTPAVNP